MQGQQGLFVVFLGPDGCGKSSVIKELTANPPQGFTKTVCFHLRPYALTHTSMSSTNSAVTDPHGKQPRGLFASVLKLFFLGLDYHIGYWAKVKRHANLGRLVIFDRYYHDLLVDPRRYRYGGPISLAMLISKVIPQPDLFILLDAPSEVLQSRKQEVLFAETLRQREAYLGFVRSRKNGLVIDASQPLDGVVSAVSGKILEFLSQVTIRRSGFECRS